jgi:hypothetical protein
MARRVYATEQEYRDWCEDQDTHLSRRDLERASAVVSEATVGAVYAYDSATLMPTSPAVLEAFRDATLEVLAARAVESEAGELAGVEEATIGSVRYKLAAGTPTSTSSGLPIEAHRVLADAGLVGQGVVVYG